MNTIHSNGIYFYYVIRICRKQFLLKRESVEEDPRSRHPINALALVVQGRHRVAHVYTYF